MSTPILVLGKSGSGKSYSIRNLDPNSTFIVNVIGKMLPWKTSSKQYTTVTSDGGNMLISDDYSKIAAAMRYVDTNRPEIKILVIDDSQYLIVNEFMRRHSSCGKGNDVFSLYNELGDHFWNLIWQSRLMRKDLFVFFLHHTDQTDTGAVKAKTIGRILDEKVDIAGMFTICLHAIANENGYFFETQNIGNTPAKSPVGMFDAQIPNDLNIVVSCIKSYMEEV